MDSNTRSEVFFRVEKVSAGTIIYPPSSRFGPRFQTDFQLVLIHTGRVKIFIDGIVHDVSPGHVVLLRPGHKEEFRFASDKETWHRWITVTTDDLKAETLEHLPFSLPISQEMNQIADLSVIIKQSKKLNLKIRSAGLD